MNQQSQQNMNDATNIIAQGYKHLQFRQGGCIIKIKSNDEIFYCVKNGVGKGKTLFAATTLESAIISLEGDGWGDIVSYK